MWQKVFGRAVQSEPSSGQSRKQTGIMRREFSLRVKNRDGPFVYWNFGGTWYIFFRIELLSFEGKSGETLILRNISNLCEIKMLLYPEDLRISRVLSMPNWQHVLCRTACFHNANFVIVKTYYYWTDGVLFKLCKELITYMELWILSM